MERFANVEVSLSSHHHDTVDTACECHLGEGEDDWGGVGLDRPGVSDGDGREPV